MKMQRPVAVWNWMRQRWPFLLSLVIVLLAGTYFARVWSRPIHTPFRAELQTKSVAFSLGDWRESAGIFTSDEARVNIVFEGPCVVSASGQRNTRFERCPSLTQVRLVILVMSQDLQVTLDTETPGLLRYVLKPRKEGRLMSVLLDDRSSLPEHEIELPAKGTTAEYWISSPDNNQLEFSVRFGKTVPTAEEKIALRENSGIVFDFNGSSAIVGPDSVITLGGSDQRLVVQDGLRIRGLRRTLIKKLMIDPSTSLLHLNVSGEAEEIYVRTGDSESQVAETRWSRLLPQNKTTTDVLTAVGSLAAGLGAIGYMVLYALREFAPRKTEDDKAKSARK